MPDYLAFARDELTDHLVYEALARRERDPENKAWLLKLSAQEQSHYEFWKTFIPKTPVRPHRLTLLSASFFRTILGVTFTSKFLERREEDTITGYEKALEAIPARYHGQVRRMIADERTHEQSIIARLKEVRVAYIGFIALGLADAIVEITGVHAGFLGVTRSTLLAGISGVIVGVAAAISMGSAAYLQAKQDPEKSPFVSGLATGCSYLLSVILLATPYFLIRAMLTAFLSSTAVGIVLLASFTYYGAVVFNRKFMREFGIAASLMLGTALVTYVLGSVIGGSFHLNANNF